MYLRDSLTFLIELEVFLIYIYGIKQKVKVLQLLEVTLNTYRSISGPQICFTNDIQTPKYRLSNSTDFVPILRNRYPRCSSKTILKSFSHWSEVYELSN